MNKWNLNWFRYYVLIDVKEVSEHIQRFSQPWIEDYSYLKSRYGAFPL